MPVMSSRSVRDEYDREGALYHQQRQDSCQGYWNREIDQPAIARLLRPHVAGQRVLDLGCGSGLLANLLKGWGAKVMGVDFSQTMIDIARRELPDIEFFCGPAHELRFANTSFDVVCSTLMLHYERDVARVFREVHRVLDTDGRWVFSFHHPFAEVVDFGARDLPAGGEAVTAEVGNYFERNAYTWSMADMQLESFHHTFEDIFEALFETGFVVERLLEPTPRGESRDQAPADFVRCSRFPSFCTISARRR